MSLQGLTVDNTWSLFLDRDGVINKRIVGGYAKNWDQFEFLPGVRDALKIFPEHFNRIFVVSNQQGIGKGITTVKELESIHARMMENIHNSGGRIDKIYFSPHLESDRSFMRKPRIGMALRARKDFPEIRLRQSFMVGDSISDMVFGKRVRMTTVFLSEDNSVAKKHPGLIDFLFPDLISFALQL